MGGWKICWMNHNILNQMNFLRSRFSDFGIFGIWHDYNAYHPVCLPVHPLIFIKFERKFINTMCCCNHKMWRNDWSRAESMKRMHFFLIVVESWSWKVGVKRNHKAPFFFWERKSLIIYFSKDTFQKILPKFVTCMPFIILLSVAIIEWRPKQNRKIIWNCIFSLSNPKL